MRSSVVPQTIASETAQKTNWKNAFDSIVALDRAITGKLSWNSVTPSDVDTYEPRFVKKKPPSWPIKPPSGPPNANAKPQIHHPTAAIEKLVRIFATTVPAFFALENPISRNANPACMNITRQPARTTHMVLMPTELSSFPAIAFVRSVESANAAPGATSIAMSAAINGSATAVRRLIRYTLLAPRRECRRCRVTDS